MVNASSSPAGPPHAPSGDHEVALAISYAPAAVRARLTTLWDFDARLADIVRTTREPMIGRMRLTWWFEAVTGAEGPVGEPLVAAVRAAALDPMALERMIDGWEALLDGDLQAYALGRGGGLFTAAAAVLGMHEPVVDAGAGWALVDLARHHSDPATAARALGFARGSLEAAPRRWARSGRPLGALAKLARRDLEGLEPQGSPRRVLAAGMLALTGC